MGFRGALEVPRFDDIERRKDENGEKAWLQRIQILFGGIAQPKRLVKIDNDAAMRRRRLQRFENTSARALVCARCLRVSHGAMMGEGAKYC